MQAQAQRRRAGPNDRGERQAVRHAHLGVQLLADVGLDLRQVGSGRCAEALRRILGEPLYGRKQAPPKRVHVQRRRVPHHAGQEQAVGLVRVRVGRAANVREHLHADRERVIVGAAGDLLLVAHWDRAGVEQVDRGTRQPVGQHLLDGRAGTGSERALDALPDRAA